jgi:hypothetical protein
MLMTESDNSYLRQVIVRNIKFSTMKRTVSDRSRILFTGLLIIIAGLRANTQTATVQAPQQYLFPSFSKGVVKLKTGKEANLILNYNMVSEKLVFEQKEQYFDLSNPETVDTAYIQNRKFVPHAKEFIEVSVTGDFPFYIQHKADLQAPPRPGAYGTTSELTSSNYLEGMQTNVGYVNFKLPEGYTIKSSLFYWIRKGEEWIKINSEKQVPKIFPESEEKIKKFIKENKIKADRTEDMIKLGIFCNGLTK